MTNAGITDGGSVVRHVLDYLSRADVLAALHGPAR